LDRQRIFSALDEIFRDTFMRDDIVVTEELTADSVPGWDSVKFIQIVMAIESKFGFSFSTKELDSLSRVGELVEIISKRTAT
jgi:acyl carrier protein